MNGKRIAMATLGALAGLVCLLTASTPLFAQAWVPPKGVGSISFTYQDLEADRHLFSRFVRPGTNRSLPFDVSANVGLLGLDYGFTDRLTLSADVAYIRSSYNGPRPEGAIDDGAYHGDFQDFLVGLRYMALKGPLILTPSVGLVIPTHNYETFGHAAVGRGLKEIQVGVQGGAVLGRILPNPYISAGYSYALVEKHENHGLNRSNAYLELGYLLTRSVSVRAFGQWQRTHGGIDWLEVTPTSDEFHAHDAAAAAAFWRAGVGAAYSVSPSVHIYAAFSDTLSGRNTHEARSFTVGTSWNFGASVGQQLASGNSTRVASLVPEPAIR